MADREREWHGDEIRKRIGTATGRALIAISEMVVVDGKEFAHVISGTLRRSIHAAPRNYIGSGDQAEAELGIDLGGLAGGEPLLVEHVWDGEREDAVTIVGSWIDYACVEETGRNHKFMTPAVEGVMGPRSDRAVRRAFAEEGL